MKTVTAIANQTVWDIALQEMGDIVGAFDIMAQNAFIRPDTELTVGQLVLVPDTVIGAGVVDYFTRNNIKPVSGLGEKIALQSEDMIQIKQLVDYNLAGGDKSFDGVRLPNLGDELSVQINYTVLTGEVGVYVEQSLDGISFSAITGAVFQLDGSKPSHTFNIAGLVTDFTRIRLDVSGATGTIDELIWRV